MENTGLTMGRDKDFPFRVLVMGHVGFGHLLIQLGSASLPAPPWLPGNFRRLGRGSQDPVTLGHGGPGYFSDALEQGSEVGELGPLCMASFSQAREAVGLNVTFLNM